MPEENRLDSTATDWIKSGGGCSGLFAYAALISFALLIVLISANSWMSTDFPRVAPEEMANRAFQHSQEAYDVLGFDHTAEAPDPRSGFSSDYCYDGGPLGLEDEIVDGAYRMHHGWRVDHVPASQAAAGLRRLHRQLKDDGWEVTSYSEDPAVWELLVRRDGRDERMSFSWYPERGDFTGGVSVPCAFDPDWQKGDPALPE